MFLITSCILVGVIFSAHADLQQTVDLLEKKVENLEEQLEYGGKRYQSITYSKLCMSLRALYMILPCN